jgi:hypothetical protein
MDMFEQISDTTENVTLLPVTTLVQNTDKRVVYSVPVTAAAGDKMIFSFAGEVTNTKTYNMMLGRGVILATSADAVSGIVLTRFATENITPAEHHKIFGGSGVHTFNSAFSGFLNVVIYAGAGVAQPGDVAPVEQGYGRLDVAMFRAVQSQPATPPDGSVTLTAAQAAQIKSALLDGHAERTAAAALLP